MGSHVCDLNLIAVSMCWVFTFEAIKLCHTKKIRNAEAILCHRDYFAKQAHLKQLKIYFKGISIFKRRLFSHGKKKKKKKENLHTDEFCNMQVTERGFNISFEVSLETPFINWTI